MDVSMRVACKTKVLFMGGGKATVKGVKEVEGGERFKGIEGLTWKVNSGVVDQMGERWGEKEVYGKVKKIELSRLPYLRRLTSISSLSNLHELCLDMCNLTTLPTLPLNLRRLSASDNSISTIDDAWEGEGEIMLEYVDIRGNLLKSVPKIMKGERMKKLKTARLDGCDIKVDELVKFSMECKIKLC
ncbi:hypothetical protein TrCOL_g5350 [Triparma columacea]|uniref:Uncharacterized protein n=1 Tax=Triparma columacea TaxID=722753 RepID=A0A9W7GPR6_9STRA|nr:hypothetical protein TrCOL_g5350 [Triparma columacea]